MTTFCNSPHIIYGQVQEWCVIVFPLLLLSFIIPLLLFLSFFSNRILLLLLLGRFQAFSNQIISSSSSSSLHLLGRLHQPGNISLSPYVYVDYHSLFYPLDFHFPFGQNFSIYFHVNYFSHLAELHASLI